MILLIYLQIKECIEAAKEVVKYFKNKTAVHGLLDKARKHVKVSVLVLQCQSIVCITHCIGQHSQLCRQWLWCWKYMSRCHVTSVYGAPAVAAG